MKRHPGMMCPATGIAQAVRPAGKRMRKMISAVVLVNDCQLVTGGRAPGIEAEMIFGGNACRGRSEVPLPPIVGNGMEVRFKPKIIVAESPTARRLYKGYRLWVIGYRMEVFGTAGVMVRRRAGAP